MCVCVCVYYADMRSKMLKTSREGVSSALLFVSIAGAYTPSLFQKVHGSHEMDCQQCDELMLPMPGASSLNCTNCYWKNGEVAILEKDPVYLTRTRYLVWASGNSHTGPPLQGAHRSASNVCKPKAPISPNSIGGTTPCCNARWKQRSKRRVLLVCVAPRYGKLVSRGVPVQSMLTPRLWSQPPPNVAAVAVVQQACCGLLPIAYIAGLLYTLRTHTHIYESTGHETDDIVRRDILERRMMAEEELIEEEEADGAGAGAGAGDAASGSSGGADAGSSGGASDAGAGGGGNADGAGLPWMDADGDGDHGHDLGHGELP